MGYQALLFSSDEKTTRVVAQILRDLDFRVEDCAEPFAAVKQITSQHYDALVVDCDNEPNAALLFKSARNSDSNSGCLTVALVQGQGGIAKAFRIGANLILTKPINVEQSKGTLRVARGLLRKAEAAKSASAAATQSSVAAQSDLSQASAVASPAPVPSIPLLPAHSEFSVGAIASTALELQEEQFPELGAAEAALLESMPKPLSVQPSQPEASGSQGYAWQSAAKSATEPAAMQLSAGSAASAAAPARAVTPAAAEPVAEPSIIAEEREISAAPAGKSTESSARRGASAKSSTANVDLPNFGGLVDSDADLPQHTDNKRNFLIAAVLVLAAAGAIYYVGPQLQSLLTSLPIVQKYFGPAPAPRPAAVPSVQPATSPQSQTAPGAGTAQPQASSADAGQTPAPQASASAASTASSSPAGANQPPAAAPADSTDKSAAASTSSSDNAGSAQHAPHLAPEVAAGLLIEKVDPTYPSAALQKRIEGSVELRANIGKDGTTSNIKILSGKPALATAAVAAVRQWKYTPYQLDGQPTEVQTEITVDFKLPSPTP